MCLEPVLRLKLASGLVQIRSLESTTNPAAGRKFLYNLLYILCNGGWLHVAGLKIVWSVSSVIPYGFSTGSVLNVFAIAASSPEYRFCSDLAPY